MNQIRVARLHPDAILPTRKHATDAGLDLYALESCTIGPHDLGVVRTGITVEVAAGYFGLVKAKSRNDHVVGAGVLDAGYQGEVLIKVINPYDRPLEIPAGQAIAQLLIVPIQTPEVVEVDPAAIHAQVTPRGATGGIHGGKEREARIENREW